jgi:hypothetical protein
VDEDRESDEVEWRDERQPGQVEPGINLRRPRHRLLSQHGCAPAERYRSHRAERISRAGSAYANSAIRRDDAAANRAREQQARVSQH